MGVTNPGAIPGMVGAGGTPLGDPYGYKELRRTPSTSAIYETLRRSKELRESLTSRPSSRLSIDNNMPTGTRDHSAVRIIFNNSLPKLAPLIVRIWNDVIYVFSNFSGHSVFLRLWTPAYFW